jgi:endonuclease YncB( thermonuclease family)
VIAAVIDGDTVGCDEARQVRLLLIDAPEMEQGAYGQLAREALLQLVPIGTPVMLEIDVDPEDQYERTLAYVVLSDGRIVNEELLRTGVAVVSVYPPNVRHVDRIRAVSEEAQEAGRGLWALDAFSCLPADFRAGNCGQ